MTSPFLHTRSLSCERGERQLFRNLDFALSAGQALRVEGENGTGKTSLLRILSGLSSEYSGEVYCCDHNIRDSRAELYSNLLYLGHRPAVKLVLTPLENLRWWCALHIESHSQPAENELIWALSQMGLDQVAHTTCYELSAGQQRRVALSRLFLAKKDFWILDEPFTAIDSRGVALLEQHMASHLESGGMLLITSHQTLAIDGVSSLALSQYQ